jgi:hypothetical protein
MNQVFDFQRWLLLVGKHWGENRKKYLLSLVALASLMIIWYIFVMLIERRTPFFDEMQVAIYYIGMAIIGCLFGSLIFSEAASGPRAMHFMSVPASLVEKLLCALLYGLVLFFVCYTLIFYLVDFTMIKLSNGILEQYWKDRDPSYVFVEAKVVNVFTKPPNTGPDFPNIFFYFFLLYFNLQSAFILGSIYFSGYSFIKTTIALLLVFLAVIFFMANMLDDFTPQGHFGDGFFTYIIPGKDGEPSRVASLPGWMQVSIKYLLMYGFLPLLWSATYFRLKEKEV